MIKIVVNSEPLKVQKNLKLSELIELLGYKESLFVVAINKEFAPASNYKDITIKDGYDIEILKPMSGG